MCVRMTTKLVLAGGVIFTLCTVGITTIYVPQFSDAGKSRREIYQRTGEVLRHDAAKRPGSMYENMNRNAKKN
mgnify:CR=1 FL=1